MVIDFIEKNFDDYNRKARLAPALLVSLPIALTIIAFFPNHVWSWGGVVSLLAWFGILKLLAQLARDMGKAKEEELYTVWGGKPTTSFLRYRNTRNKINLARQHRKLFALTKQPMPNESEELANPDLADQIYDTCTQFLLSKTRDHSKFFLIYEENCNYGFRRNLLGMKSLGIITSSIGVFFIGAQCVYKIELLSIFATWQIDSLVQAGANLQFSNCPPLSIACLLVSFFLLITWLLWINSDWVKIAADAYAIRLLESSENLS
ncbi:MAG: hypothetical protein ACTS2F_20340 [Thainema sp.]